MFEFQHASVLLCVCEAALLLVLFYKDAHGVVVLSEEDSAWSVSDVRCFSVLNSLYT